MIRSEHQVNSKSTLLTTTVNGGMLKSEGESGRVNTFGNRPAGGPSGPGKEDQTMAVKHIDINGYCDSLYGELLNIQNRIGELVSEVEQMSGKDRSVLESHIRHLNEIKQTIGWKMEIFSKSCPVDWSKFGKESESTASVQTTEVDMPAGGFAGG